VTSERPQGALSVLAVASGSVWSYRSFDYPRDKRNGELIWRILIGPLENAPPPANVKICAVPINPLNLSVFGLGISIGPEWQRRRPRRQHAPRENATSHVRCPSEFRKRWGPTGSRASPTWELSALALELVSPHSRAGGFGVPTSFGVSPQAESCAASYSFVVAGLGGVLESSIVPANTAARAFQWPGPKPCE
jgi:hypothetical protein